MSHVKVPCLALAVILALSCSVFGAAKDRSYVAGRYLLTLDGVKVGFVKSVEGGDVTAEVIQEPVGPDYIVHKHIGKPKYEDFEIQVGFNMGKPLYEWIRQSWTPNVRRMTGSITAMDFNHQPKSEQQFVEALVTATTIPAVDAASKDPGYLTIRFSPECTRPGKPSGKSDAATGDKGMQKTFLPANFRLEIDGLNCKGVSRIESFTVKRTAVKDSIGDARDQKKEPGKLEFPNLTITLAEKGAESWLAWHDAFVVQGKNDQKSEKNGSLTLLSPNLKEELATIRFYNMGIFSLKSEKAEANNEAIRHLVAELYVEKMEFECKLAASAGADTTETTPAEPPPTTRPLAPKTVRRTG
jgi:hypothetical protein